MSNPRDLLLHQLSELLWIEQTLFFEVLPSVHDEARDPDLQQALTEHRSVTRTHATRVEAAIRAAGAEPAAARSAALDAMTKQHSEQAGEIKQPVLKDVFHCAGVARAEHLELAAYDAAIGLAESLGLGECASLLRRNRDEDANALDEAEKLAARLRDALPR
jgi:ferritin-like metal-binding protein YciE